MLEYKTKLIIATNRPNTEHHAVETNSLIAQSERFWGQPPVFLERPSAEEVVFETEKISKTGFQPILMPLGGDGTINWHLNNFESYSPDTVLAPFPAGTANDISTTINGRKPSFSRLLSSATIKEARPITIEYEGQTVRALGYIGLGLTGLCAEAINNRQQTLPNKTLDALVTLRALASAKQNPVSDVYGRNIGQFQEIAAINSRMATFLWPKPETVSIYKEYFNLVLSKNYLTTANLAIKGLSHQLAGRKITYNNNFLFNKPSSTPTISGQADGEPFKIHEGLVKIYKSDSSVKLLSLY